MVFMFVGAYVYGCLWWSEVNVKCYRSVSFSLTLVQNLLGCIGSLWGQPIRDQSAAIYPVPGSQV